MLLKFFSYALPIVGLIGIGLVAYLKNTRDRMHILFFAVSLTLAVWLSALFVGDLMFSRQISLWAIRVGVAVGTLIVPELLCFSLYFPVKVNRFGRILYAFAFVPALAFFLFSFTPLLIPGIEFQTQSVQPVRLNLLYTLQSLYVVAGVITSIYLMWRKRQSVPARERVQIRLVVLGLVVAVITNVLVGFVLELAGLANNLSNFAGGLSFLVFVGMTGYAIIRHRLFDIRLAITRTVGYVFTIGIVSVIYCLAILGIGVPFITGDRVTFVRDNIQLFLVLPPTLLVALTFHRVQRFVAARTQNLFYQDSYDTQAILDHLSDVFISSNDLMAIIRRGMAVLNEVLKPTHMLCVILDEQGSVHWQHTLNHHPFPQLEALVREAKQMRERLYVKDEIPSSQWRHLLEHGDISVMLRLETNQRVIGMLFLGPKQNGRIYTRQDIELLGTSSKNFGIAIENAKKYAQIAAFADTMRQEVAHATTQLRKANAELKTLDSLKDDFISMVSHQLRSPATSVHEALQMLSQAGLPAKDRKQLLQLAEASSARLVGVVTDMLSIARIQAGHLTIEKADVDMVALVSRAILEASVLAKQKGISLHFQRPPGPMTVLADRTKLNETMSNYIENAIRYSPAGGKVEISLRLADGRLYFEVRDHGIGVPPRDRKDLFGKFFRADNARKEQPNGSGIGLFVVKTIAEAHGGSAYFEPQDNGSLFGFWLPA